MSSEISGERRPETTTVVGPGIVDFRPRITRSTCLPAIWIEKS